MVKIRCVVERITYQNPDNGYSVLKCAVKNYNELVTVVGNLLDANVGSVLLIDGNWKVDAKYGRQFLAESWEETMPTTVFGIEKYLGSGLIKGVGPKFARKIVQEFGTDTGKIFVLPSGYEKCFWMVNTLPFIMTNHVLDGRKSIIIYHLKVQKHTMDGKSYSAIAILNNKHAIDGKKSSSFLPSRIRNIILDGTASHKYCHPNDVSFSAMAIAMI